MSPNDTRAATQVSQEPAWLPDVQNWLGTLASGAAAMVMAMFSAYLAENAATPLLWGMCVGVAILLALLSCGLRSPRVRRLFRCPGGVEERDEEMG